MKPATTYQEQRKYKRSVVEEKTPVFIYNRNKKIGKGYVKDIAAGGVALHKLNLSKFLPIGSILKLVFAVNLTDSLIKTHKKSGIIMRTSNDTTGITFISKR